MDFFNMLWPKDFLIKNDYYSLAITFSSAFIKDHCSEEQLASVKFFKDIMFDVAISHKINLA